ncbi:MAG: hypothetical protein MUF51_01585 [Vicinamibacteria bacterium]|jgi:hypothetical protein|nr:hypothetical protein [Vicinamibacteria bacterium]
MRKPLLGLLILTLAVAFSVSAGVAETPKGTTTAPAAKAAPASKTQIKPLPCRCCTPVLITLADGKIKSTPDPVVIFWGNGVVFDVIAEKGEKVEIQFAQDPFKKGEPGVYSIEGPGRIKTSTAVKPRDDSKLEWMPFGAKRGARYKYSIKWSGGRNKEPISIDPDIIIIDPCC